MNLNMSKICPLSVEDLNVYSPLLNTNQIHVITFICPLKFIIPTLISADPVRFIASRISINTINDSLIEAALGCFFPPPSV